MCSFSFTQKIAKFNKSEKSFCIIHFHFRIKFLVLDEADRLMDGRFDKQLKIIWDDLPEKRQTLLFSATITDRLQKMKEVAKSDVSWLRKFCFYNL